MDRFRAALLYGLQDAWDVQVRFGRSRRADAIGLISAAHVKRGAVCFGIDRHGLDAHLMTSADDADGDLATVGDQDFTEHRYAQRKIVILTAGLPEHRRKNKRPACTGRSLSIELNTDYLFSSSTIPPPVFSASFWALIFLACIVF